MGSVTGRGLRKGGIMSGYAAGDWGWMYCPVGGPYDMGVQRGGGSSGSTELKLTDS